MKIDPNKQETWPEALNRKTWQVGLDLVIYASEAARLLAERDERDERIEKLEAQALPTDEEVEKWAQSRPWSLAAARVVNDIIRVMMAWLRTRNAKPPTFTPTPNESPADFCRRAGFRVGACITTVAGVTPWTIAYVGQYVVVIHSDKGEFTWTPFRGTSYRLATPDQAAKIGGGK